MTLSIHHPTKHHTLSLLVILLLTALAIVLLLRTNFLLNSVVSPDVDPNTHQAVELDTGEVYFGRVTADRRNGFLELRNVYYFRYDDESKLVKRDDKNGPKLINRDRIISIESLKSSSPVARAIAGSEQ
ncbi:MAG: hypothetical protein ABIH35_01235 [Patescibacteria group bacterium]